MVAERRPNGHISEGVMNEYLENLYIYIMDHKFGEINERIDYLVVKREREEAERALTSILTEEEKELFDHYLEQENTVYSLELRHIFSLGFSTALRLSHS